MTTIPEGFTPHDGSGLPEGVGPDDRVDVVLCNGRIYRGFIAKFWEVGGDDYWDTFRNCYSIIAYRLHVPEPPKPDIAEILAEALVEIKNAPREEEGGSVDNCRLIAFRALQQYRDSRNG